MDKQELSIHQGLAAGVVTVVELVLVLVVEEFGRWASNNVVLKIDLLPNVAFGPLTGSLANLSPQNQMEQGIRLKMGHPENGEWFGHQRSPMSVPAKQGKDR